MKSRAVALFLAIILSLPAFSQSREVLVSEDSIVSPILGALNFVEEAYGADEALKSYHNPGTTEGVLDMLLTAYTDSTDLFQHRITSNFGFREDFGKMHWGVDLSMDSGEAIPIPLAGLVFRTGYDEDGYGNYIIVSHSDGLETRYAHLKEILVHPGDTLAAGTVIATCGSTGNSTAPTYILKFAVTDCRSTPCRFFGSVNS